MGSVEAFDWLWLGEDPHPCPTGYTTNPEVRVVALGVPDRLMEQAPRQEQLESFGLTAEGIARRIAALHHEESLEPR